MVTYNANPMELKNGNVEMLGLSTDTKPADAPENTLFLELDTGKFYYFAGNQWKEVGT